MLTNQPLFFTLFKIATHIAGVAAVIIAALLTIVSALALALPLLIPLVVLTGPFFVMTASPGCQFIQRIMAFV